MKAKTAKDKGFPSLLKDHPEGLTRQQICDELESVGEHFKGQGKK